MAVAVGRTSVADRTKTLKVGDPAPDFELAGHRDASEKFKLSTMRGKKNVVLVFYPLDWTAV
jgi:peroxiredoxin